MRSAVYLVVIEFILNRLIELRRCGGVRLLWRCVEKILTSLNQTNLNIDISTNNDDHTFFHMKNKK